MSLFPPTLFSSYELGRGFLLILERCDFIHQWLSCNLVCLVASEHTEVCSLRGQQVHPKMRKEEANEEILQSTGHGCWCVCCHPSVYCSVASADHRWGQIETDIDPEFPANLPNSRCCSSSAGSALSHQLPRSIAKLIIFVL